MSIKNKLKDAFRRIPQEPVFVRNVNLVRERADHKELVGGVLGAPQASEYYTAEKLASEGLAGLYRTGRKEPVFEPRY